MLHNLSHATTFWTNSILSYGSFMCLAFTFFTMLTFYVYEFCIFSLSFVLSFLSLAKNCVKEKFKWPSRAYSRLFFVQRQTKSA